MSSPEEPISFATVGDLETRWKPLGQDDWPKATALLEDASEIVKARAPHWGQVSPRILTTIVCEMVVGAMGKPDLFGVTSLQQAAGPYQETQSFANPMGDLYLSAKHLLWLGVKKQRAFTISMGPHKDHHDRG